MNSDSQVLTYDPDGMLIMDDAVFSNLNLRQAILADFRDKILIEGVDYGVIPSVDKPFLLKPGAEKLQVLYGFEPEIIVVDKDRVMEGPEPYLYVEYQVNMKRGDIVHGTGVGACTTKESKYRSRWVAESDIPSHYTLEELAGFEKRDGTIREMKFAVEKKETTGSWGKPQEYWDAIQEAIDEGVARSVMIKTKRGQDYEGWEIPAIEYFLPNPRIFDQFNTVIKMAFKRAHVAAVLNGTGASQYFTQDPEAVSDSQYRIWMPNWSEFVREIDDALQFYNPVVGILADIAPEDWNTKATVLKARIESKFGAFVDGWESKRAAEFKAELLEQNAAAIREAQEQEAKVEPKEGDAE